jgi:hypothetical protein
MLTTLVFGIFLLLLALVAPKVIRVLWFLGLTLAVWGVVIFALLVINNMARG